MRVPVRDPPAWEVHTIATHQAVPVEHDLSRELRVGLHLVFELPDQRTAAHRRGPEVRGVALDVIDGDVAARGFDAVRVLVERQDQ